MGLTVMVRSELLQSTSGSLTSSSSSLDPSWCVAWILYTPITTITTRAAIQTTITTVAAGGAAPEGQGDNLRYIILYLYLPSHVAFKSDWRFTWHLWVDGVYHKWVMDRSHVLRLGGHVIDMFHVWRVVKNADLQTRTKEVLFSEKSKMVRNNRKTL